MNQIKTLYSIVIPVYNSEKTIKSLVDRIIVFFKKNNLDFEIILINDHSNDKSWEKIKKITQEEENITAINFLKNYGQHNALFCGLKTAKGDYVITMDDDLQNPPEEIIHLINKINEGYDSVFGKYKKRQHQDIIRLIGSKLIHSLINKIFNVPPGIAISSFRIISRNVVAGIINYKTNFPYITGLMFLFSGSTGNAEVEHCKREYGKSNYSAFRIIKHASKILLNYSSYPLIILCSVGIIISSISFLFGIFVLIKHFISGSSVPGWASLALLTSFLNGFIILMVGILSEYCSRILVELSSTQSYQIKEIIKKEGAVENVI